MARVSNLKFGSVIFAIAITGCGESTTPPTSQTPVNSATASSKQRESATAKPTSDPRVETASAFLQAVIRGDTELAFRQLTPTAIRQIESGGKAFAPPGLDSASFEIGQIRQPSPSQAVVQCIIQDENVTEQPAQKEEMCCMLRQVDSTWKVYAIAFDAGPNRDPMILNFEQPTTPKQAKIEMVQTETGQQEAEGTAPRTALDPFQTPQR